MGPFAEAIAGTLLPSQCSTCGDHLPMRGSEAGICAQCWSDLPRPHPGCPSCADFSASSDGPCLGCQDQPPPWHGLVTLGPYLGRWRDLVLLFKHRRRDELARPLGDRVADALRASGLRPPQCVVPVPMWWLRRAWRGFNQAELLARRIAVRVHIPVINALSRSLGRSQTGRRRSERTRLARAEFRIRRPVPRRVGLVDDVLTTGATARACCHALTRAGAREVILLTVARTPRLWRSS